MVVEITWFYYGYYACKEIYDKSNFSDAICCNISVRHNLYIYKELFSGALFTTLVDYTGWQFFWVMVQPSLLDRKTELKQTKEM